MCGGNPVYNALISSDKKMKDKVLLKRKRQTSRRLDKYQLIVISPSGLIGPCQAFLGINEFFPYSVDQMHAKLEQINSDYLYNESDLFSEWRQRFPLNMKDCIDCYAISICGGGCPYAAYVNHSSIWEIDDRICHQAKQIFEWMIWDAYQNQLRLNEE
ncbi:hypothetical protein SPSYN_01962 [Sporotomaculum syntrophicum]|uniref:SPASM domain-containing protein n=1 Tax=Sporotomaculum syntrophicum TaxID=182264 RepID=A0A9D3AX94_9FIRM|nr:SPASM domain-containing protein [Sporotomaculum syntrophicum]KAF1084792.1 hypothetical protein SPSYN_01962 [Sporotomaculum syntrophicum]